jgi:2-keto-4-pentenoate hydratase/2-oxohepta-3-ene-1,7-dioic acid hydratase in catechol pathway
MKLLRYGEPGHERPGAADSQGRVRNLSGLIDDLTPRSLSPEVLATLQAVDINKLPLVAGNPRLGIPVHGIRQVIAIGLNYTDHAKEAGLPIPQEPVMFTKWLSCLGGPNDDIVAPSSGAKLDWEVEIGMVIGSTARGVTEAEALSHVAGYCVANDVTERAYQFDRSGGQWSKGKGFDTFGPVGPYLVTRDEVPDPQDLGLWLDVNGVRMQSGSTSTMIFTCARLVSYCSSVMTLHPGDLIITGTPAGVGMGMKPPKFLAPGDVVTLGITGLGTQRQQVVNRG